MTLERFLFSPVIFVRAFFMAVSAVTEPRSSSSTGFTPPHSARHTKMSKFTTGVAYSASAGSVLHGVLTYFSPEEWSAVGVLVGISIATVTCITNWYYRRKATLAEIRALRCTCRDEPR